MTEEHAPDLPPGFLDAFRRMRHEPPIVFSLRQHEAWLIIAMLQLAACHPAAPAHSIAAARRFGDQLAAAITDVAMRQYLALGWDPALDQPVKEDAR